MPITALDSRTALVVIDMQKGIASGALAHPVAGVSANVLRLTQAFRARGLPVVLVRVEWTKDFAKALRLRTQAPPPPLQNAPPEFFEYIDGLSSEGGTDILVPKRLWGAFYGTDLDLQLRHRQVTGIVLCGISTSIGVESTARDAWERAYNLTFASDALTDRVAEAHERAMSVIFPRLGEIGTTDEIIAFLATRAESA
jgi:nicotinamidase-related amidase